MKLILRRIADYIRECDKLLYILVILTSLYGCVAVLSTTYNVFGQSIRQFTVQLISLGIGLIAIIVISNFDYRHFAKFWPVFVAGAVALVVLTFFIGYSPGNTDDKAWLLLPGGMSLQPAELLKIAFIVSFSYHCFALGDKIKQFKHVVLLCLHGAAPVLLIHFQGDDGTALIIAIMFVGMMFAAGVKLRYFIIALALAVTAAPFVYLFVMNNDQKMRISALFFGAETNYLDTLYQQWRGRVALANGGIFGQGLFKGTLVQTRGIPESYNDFIFASIGEELGLVGCFAVIILLTLICLRILKVGSLSNNKLGNLICTGVFVMIAATTIINIGMCLWMLPVIGVTLPFFSAGGTNLVCTMLGIALVMSVYLHRSTSTIHLKSTSFN